MDNVVNMWLHPMMQCLVRNKEIIIRRKKLKEEDKYETIGRDGTKRKKTQSTRLLKEMREGRREGRRRKHKVKEKQYKRIRGEKDNLQ